MNSLIVRTVLVTFLMLVGSTSWAGFYTIEPFVHGRYASPQDGFFTDAVRFTTDSVISSLSGVPIGNGGNHATGLLAFGSEEWELRNYFVYDLSSVSGTITSAALWFDQPNNGFVSQDLTETYGIFGITSPLLANGLLGGSSQFSDLGSGTSYASAVLDSSSNNSTVVIMLNEEALTSMRTSAGGQFGFGTAVTSLQFGQSRRQVLFGFTGAEVRRKLVIATDGDTIPDVPPTAVVPEPSSGCLFGVGMMLCAMVRRRTRTKYWLV